MGRKYLAGRNSLLTPETIVFIDLLFNGFKRRVLLRAKIPEADDAGHRRIRAGPNETADELPCGEPLRQARPGRVSGRTDGVDVGQVVGMFCFPVFRSQSSTANNVLGQPRFQRYAWRDA